MFPWGDVIEGSESGFGSGGAGLEPVEGVGLCCWLGFRFGFGDFDWVGEGGSDGLF